MAKKSLTWQQIKLLSKRLRESDDLFVKVKRPGQMGDYIYEELENFLSRKYTQMDLHMTLDLLDNNRLREVKQMLSEKGFVYLKNPLKNSSNVKT